MDAGGLAQMTYSNFASPMNSGLGAPGVGFATRGKAHGLKRLSVAAPPKVASIAENQADLTPTPRTSRSHLLAGLRTAPKTPAAPASAPYSQMHHGLNAAKYGSKLALGNGIPHTAIGSGFTTQQLAMNPGQQFYALPEQVLAPPPLEFDEAEQLDPVYLAQLAAAEQCLNQRAQMLQHQLATLQLAGRHLQQSNPQTPVTPQMSLYQQQLINGVSPIPQEVPGHPGLYVVFNPLTGQYTYAVDPAAQPTPQLSNSPPPPTPTHTAAGFNVDAPTFRAEVSPPVETARMSSPFGSRSLSPPKKTPSPPQDVTPLPPPSANAFRRGHNKRLSALSLSTVNVQSGPKSAFVRPVGMPITPTTGTFGPGQNRAGEHPTRQPRGPPSFEELKEKPTTKHEGSKNFATRTRRKALHSLVRAGLERRVRPGSGSTGSITPVSESELTFSIPSDNDSDGGRSNSLTSKPSIGSLRAAASGAIGSERQRSKERLSSPTSSSHSDEESVDEPRTAPISRQRTPLLMLANAAEKRKSTLL